MLRSSNVLILLGISLILAVHAVQGLPHCAADDEPCRDRHMHPDLTSAEELATGPLKRIEGEDTNEYWLEKGKVFVREKLTAKRNENVAKNIILFLGDGMGVTTIAAARNVIGGEEQQHAFEKFPYTGLAKTYAVDIFVPDSACTSTAYLGGVKAQEATIGVNAKVDRLDCVAMQDEANHVHSIAKWAMDAGKSAGFVTTTRVTHASPAGVYAHTAEREWENDAELIKGCGSNSGAQDIAQQLIHGDTGSRLKVMMGGGRKNFIDRNLYVNGSRIDGRNLINEFVEQGAGNVYVETREQLLNLNLDEAERILGVFEDSHMLYHLETDEHSKQPTLEEMTRVAIKHLSKNDKGYFIFIEGGKIDLAHHDNMARLALDETAEFSKAIQAAREITNEEDTLIITTADHSHSFTYSGYPSRGANIFGKSSKTPDDKKPYLTLSYANGPSYEKFFDVKRGERRDPLAQLTGDPHDQFPATFPLDSETHGGDDVAVYASGPWAHLFTGVYEQNAIPHMMGYAACIGDGLKACDNKS